MRKYRKDQYKHSCSDWYWLAGSFHCRVFLIQKLRDSFEYLGSYMIVSLYFCSPPFFFVVIVCVRGGERTFEDIFFVVLIVTQMGKGCTISSCVFDFIFHSSEPLHSWRTAWGFQIFGLCFSCDFPHPWMGKPVDAPWSIPGWSRPPWNLDSLSRSQGSSFQGAGTSSCGMILPNPRPSYWWVGGSGVAA